MIHTPVCDLLGIRYPILQGGMAWIADAELAAAVSNAGGLGIISAMNAGGDWVREQIRKAKSLTTQPFGVNIMLASPHAEEVAQIVIEEQVPVVTTGYWYALALVSENCRANAPITHTRYSIMFVCSFDIALAYFSFAKVRFSFDLMLVWGKKL